MIYGIAAVDDSQSSNPPAEAIADLVSSFKLLGVWHQNNLKWNTHIEKIAKKAGERLFCLRECRRINLPTEIGVMCYQTKLDLYWSTEHQFGTESHNI